MSNGADRRWDLDAIRGLMLVLMTLTHLPTRVSDPAGQPFGFVSAAEGFVMLSAFMAGMVYSARARRDGDVAMQEAFFKRALKIYACQAALLLFLFTVIAMLGLVGREEAVTNLLSFYFERPFAAFFSGLLLIYNPALLDILPIYILFMLVSPLVLLHGMHRGWIGIMAVSVLLWCAAQFDLSLWLYSTVNDVVRIPVRYQDMGAFEIFAWQFLWILGLWMGATMGHRGAQPTVFPGWMVRTALVVAIVGFVWRHAVGQTPFPGEPTLNLLFDKWHVGPLRLINFFALLVLVMHYGEALKRLPRLKALETLGQASLPVFCAHLVIALMALAIYGEPKPSRPVSVDVIILAGAFAVLYAVAWVSGLLDRRAAALGARLKARRGAGAAAVTASSGVPRSPVSTVHIPTR